MPNLGIFVLINIVINFVRRFYSKFKIVKINSMNSIHQYRCVKYPNIPLSPCTRYNLSMLDNRRKVLVLDLDETLIHSYHDNLRMPCSSAASSSSAFSAASSHAASSSHPAGPGVSLGSADFVLKVPIDYHPIRFFVYKRPHVDFFLDVISQWFTLVIYTASQECYGSMISERLDAGRHIIERRLYRQHCVYDAANGTYTKNLCQIESDLSQVLIIDNSPSAYRNFRDNAVPIVSWFCDPRDTELLNLLPFLDSLRFVRDVRSVLCRHPRTANMSYTHTNMHTNTHHHLNNHHQQHEMSTTRNRNGAAPTPMQLCASRAANAAGASIANHNHSRHSFLSVDSASSSSSSSFR